MKIDDIDAFVEVIRCQSISHAAESLQLTQPAITRRVQNFEQALGVELFDRNTKPLKPTLIGTRVYEQCRLILREMDALRELVATDAPPTGVLRLGVPQTIGDAVLLDALKQLRTEYPDLRAQVRVFGTQLLERIQQHRIADGLRHTQAQHTGRRRVRGYQLTQGIHLTQDQTALLIDPGADQRRLEGFGIAVEQLHTQRLLEVLHTAGDSRLGQLQRLGCMADGLATNHFDKGIDIVNFHLGRT